MKCLPKNLTRLYKLGIKTGVWYPKSAFGPLKWKNIYTFYTKNEVFAQKFDPIVQIGDKNRSLVHPNVHLSRKMERFVLFTLKMKFCTKI